MTNALLALAFIAALAACSCSVDQRTLRLGPDASAAGAPAAGAAGDGDATPSMAGSTAGAPFGDGLVEGCADLDTDGTSDCAVTLLDTPTFDRDVSAWTAVEPAELAWDPRNARADAPSGSGRLSARMAPARAFQCVALAGPQLVIGYADAFVVQRAGSTHLAQALLEVSFFEDEDCQGERERFFETPSTTITNAWSTVHAGGLATATTRSVAIALVAASSVAPDEVEAYFDNVMLKAQAP